LIEFVKEALSATFDLAEATSGWNGPLIILGLDGWIGVLMNNSNKLCRGKGRKDGGSSEGSKRREGKWIMHVAMCDRWQGRRRWNVELFGLLWIRLFDIVCCGLLLEWCDSVELVPRVCPANDEMIPIPQYIVTSGSAICAICQRLASTDV
jgi:hypothetical protein